tara:strand:- start:82 stop:729 length:648 start_codon:yes stop_codon:yes gene_type:complete
MKIQFLLLTFLLSISLSGQSDSAKNTMLELLEKLDNTPAYECDIKIMLDVKFIKMKERFGRMFYTSAEEVDYKIKGFAFLPKKELASSSTELLKKDFIAVYLPNETIREQKCSVIKVIPMDLESSIVTGQFWINNKQEINRMTFITKEDGAFTADLFYNNIAHNLPSKLRISFNVKDQKLPALITGDLEGYSSEEPFEEVSRGKIEIEYTNHTFK